MNACNNNKDNNFFSNSVPYIDLHDTKTRYKYGKSTGCHFNHWGLKREVTLTKVINKINDYIKGSGTTHSYRKTFTKEKKLVEKRKLSMPVLKKGKLKLVQSCLIVSRGGRVGGQLTNFYTGRLCLRSNTLPFYIPFFTKKGPLSYNFCWQMVTPLHTSFRTLHPIHCHLNRNQLKK